MKLITFSEDNRVPRPGLLLENTIIDLSARFEDVLSIIEGGHQSLALVEKLAADKNSLIPISSARLHAPLQNPPRIFCVGLNYRDHAIESKMEIPRVPTVFMKLSSALIGDRETIVLPGISEQPDYEAELAIVIGKGGRNISPGHWHHHVFGYTILNDVSARDIQLATSQWTLGKSFDTFAPLGPAIVTKDEIADPHQLSIQLSIDGEILQSSNTRELIFKAPELIAYISAIAPLQAGDIISTGTPAGVGLGRTPKRWLKPGELVTIEISGIGKLSNPTAAENHEPQ